MKKFDSILKKSSEIKDYRSFDVNVEWKQFSFMLIDNKSEDNEIVEQVTNFHTETNRHIIYILAFAASTVLVFSAIFMFKKKEVLTAELTTAAASEKIELIDGTAINVGTKSTLQYYTSLDHQNLRSVKLSGKATFDVARSILPFKVYYENIIVEVIGTSFSLNKSKDTVVIINTNGSVKVVETQNHNNFKILSKGDIFHFINGNFINPKELIKKDSMGLQSFDQKKTKNSAIKDVNSTPLKVRRYSLESVIKNYLIKFNKKKIKLDKKSKPDMTLIVTMDDINKPYLAILEDLKRQGIIDFIPGDCSDCYIIRAPQKQ